LQPKIIAAIATVAIIRVRRIHRSIIIGILSSSK
jgi:hypothetical protein